MNRRDTEPYVRWCGRTVRSIPHLLPDAKKFSPGEYRQIPTKSADLPAGGIGAQRKADDSLKDEIQQECRAADD